MKLYDRQQEDLDHLQAGSVGLALALSLHQVIDPNLA